MRTLTNSLTTKKAKTNKLVLGFVGIAATTVIGTAGLAAAAQPARNPNAPNPPSKAACENYAQYGFKNPGRCVSWWEKHNNPAHGYGGGGGNSSTTNTVNSNVSLNINGDHNIVNVAFNYFFGN